LTDPVVNQVGAAVVGGLITSAVGAAVLLINNWHTRSRENRADSLKEWQDAAAMHRANDAECRRRLDETNQRASRLEARAVRAEARIEAMEDALRRAGIEFRPYLPDPSDVHTPLPTDRGADSGR
jgi:hypothetical protein